MFYGTFFNADVAYYALYMACKADGANYFPRDKVCREIRPASFAIHNPTEALYRGKSRKLNYRFWAAETLGYISGANSERQAKLLLPINPNLGFALNPETQGFDGAYGPFIHNKLPEICGQLIKDKYTRQAIIPIWSMNTRLNSRDVPCTISLQFFHDEKCGYDKALSMHVSMRSNDLNWGLPYDIAAFAAIQTIVACSVNWLIGTYYHTAGSLHYYKDDPSQVEREPLVIPHTQEEWWKSPFLRVPIPSGCNVVSVIHGAKQVVHDIIDHYDRGFGKAPIQSPFVESLNDVLLKDYFNHWLAILNGDYKHGA